MAVLETFGRALNIQLSYFQNYLERVLLICDECATRQWLLVLIQHRTPNLSICAPILLLKTDLSADTINKITTREIFTFVKFIHAQFFSEFEHELSRRQKFTVHLNFCGSRTCS